MAVHRLPATSGADIVVDDAAADLLDDAAAEAIEGFLRWVVTSEADLGVRLKQTSVRHWQSLEDAGWRQIIVDLQVEAEDAAALRFWEQANGQLEALKAARPSPVTELLVEQVHWR